MIAYNAQLRVVANVVCMLIHIIDKDAKEEGIVFGENYYLNIALKHSRFCLFYKKTQKLQI